MRDYARENLLLSDVAAHVVDGTADNSLVQHRRDSTPTERG